MKKTRVTCLLIIIISGFSSLLSHAATLDVSIVENSFQPQNLTISIGDTVRWTNNGVFSHTTTSGTDGNNVDGMWNSGTMSSGETFSLTFNQSGVFPYHCTFHWATGMKGTVTVNSAASTLPVPAGQQSFGYNPVSSFELSNDPSQAKPVGFGPVASGGTMLNIQVGLNQLAGAVDIYGAYSLATDPGTIFILNPDGTTFTVFTLSEIMTALAAGLPPMGAQPWIANTTGSINENLLQTMISNLPSGVYDVYLLVTTPGGLVNYYLWTSFFIIP